MVLGALAGGCSSLIIFLDHLPWIIPIFLKIIFGVLLVLIAFPWKGKGVFIKTALIFIGVNFLFAGIMMALWFFVSPVDMYYRNGVVYFNISALTLAVSTIVAYFIIRLIGWILDRRVAKNSVYPIIISLDGKEALLTAFDDSGNKLSDPFDTTPVIICQYSAIKVLLPQTLQNYFSGEGSLPNVSAEWAKKIRVVPYHVVGSTGMMRCFYPDKFEVMTKKGRQEYHVLIGVNKDSLSSGEYNALFNATLLSNSI